MSGDVESSILSSEKVKLEMRDFEEWFKRYGDYLLAYEPSKVVVRTAWIARVMLDEGYALYPGREEEVRKAVAGILVGKLEELGVPRGAIRKGDLKGSRQDVVEVLKIVYPNVSQTDRPSLPAVIAQEREARVAEARFSAFSPRNPGSKYIYAYLATLVLSALLIALLSRI